jgi:hypothetical protein
MSEEEIEGLVEAGIKISFDSLKESAILLLCDPNG